MNFLGSFSLGEAGGACSRRLHRMSHEQTRIHAAQAPSCMGHGYFLWESIKQCAVSPRQEIG